MASELDEFLAAHASLTTRQIECVSLQVSAKNRLGGRSQSERPHVIAGVTEGAYYRVLEQARRNIDQAVYTMLLCSRMGILQAEDLRRLVNLMAKTPFEDVQASKEVISLIDALVRKIVML